MDRLLSVVICAYNAERFLPEALSSLEAQTFRDFEVVFVDDGSTDGTFDAAAAASLTGIDLTVLRQENRGPYEARRAGIARATGEYVAFLDADDALRDDALESIARAIERTDADLVAFDTARDRGFSRSERAGLGAGLYAGPRFGDVLECLCRGRFNRVTDKAIRRSILKQALPSSTFDGFLFGEDLLMLLPVFDQATSLVQLREALYFYRRDSAGTTSRFQRGKLEDLARTCRSLVSYAERWGEGCVRAAAVGEARQYVNLLKIVEGGPESPREKRAEIALIGEAMRSEGVFPRAASGRFRLDDRLILWSLQAGWVGFVRLLVRAVEQLKRVREWAAR